MNLDVRAIGRFSRFADEGATRAAASLSVLLGIDAVVEPGRVAIVDMDDVREALAPETHVAVAVYFRGGIDGTAVLVFDELDSDTVVSSLAALVDGDDDLAASGLTELGNVLLSGFVDGWADHLCTEIDPQPPSVLDTSSLDDLLESTSEPVLAFQNRLTAVELGVDFDVYLLPNSPSIETLLTSGDDAGIPVGRLHQFGQLVRDGAAQASMHVSALTGIETTVGVANLSFASVEHIPELVSEDPRVGVVLELVGLPSGYIAILFDEASAVNVADALVPGMDDDELRRSALMEVGNILTSGFVDGWANDLGTTIDISPPRYVHDVAPAILDPIAATLAASQDVTLLVESVVRTASGSFTCEIYVVPDERELTEALTGDSTTPPSDDRATSLGG